MAGMFLPLRMQGIDTEESGVRGEGGEMLLPKQKENRRGKNMAVYSLIVGLRASEYFLSEPSYVAFCM